MPYSHSRAIIKAANVPKKLIPIPFAGHAAEIGLSRKWFAKKLDELAAASA